jgi:hypothetical protein
VQKAIQDIRQSLMTIVAALERLAPEPEVRSGRRGRRAAAPAPAAAPARRRRKAKLTPARVKALQLQGAYMGALRSLGPRQKANVKALRASKGVEAALRLAKQLAR